MGVIEDMSPAAQLNRALQHSKVYEQLEQVTAISRAHPAIKWVALRGTKNEKVNSD